MRALVVAIFFITLVGSGFAMVHAAPDPAAARVDEILDSAIAWKLTPSLSLAVVHDGEISYVGARGGTIHTRYPIGSLGTLFIAVAILQLDAAGKLKLDDSLAKYAPPEESLDIPLRNLLPPQDDGDAKYEALGAVVERVTREPLDIYLTDHVFRPAGMTETQMGEPPEWLGLATGYFQWEDAFKEASPAKEAWTSKCCAFVSTAADLAHFDAALFHGTLIPAASFASLETAFVPGEKNGTRMIGRLGAANGYDAESFIFPDTRFAIVSLANCAGFAAPAVLDRVLDLYYPRAATASSAEDRRDPNPAISRRLRAALASRFGAQQTAGRMEFLSSSTSAGSTEYRYLVDVRGETHSAFFMMNPDGTIGTLWLHPERD